MYPGSFPVRKRHTMSTHDAGASGDCGTGADPFSPIDHVRSALQSYQVLFERAAFTAQLADDERLHRMLDALVLFGLVTDVNGEVTYMNTAMRDRLGSTLDQVVGHGLLDDASVHDVLKRSIVAAVTSEQMASHWVTEVPLSDGTTITVRWTSTFIRDSQGGIRGLTSVGEDITHVEPSGEAIAESIQMESMGRLAGGIAHDFNNYLTVIGGHTHLARVEPGLPATVEPHLDQIDAATERATELIRQLLAFGRQLGSEPTTLSVSDQLGDLAALLRPTFRASITIEVVTATNDDRITFDRSQLDQIFVNLAFNSRDAMPHGGTITYSVSDEDLDQQAAGDLGVEPGPYVVVTVTDDGVGIDADIINHVFERHVTTKPMGQGSGLGLATVRRVITHAGGAITIDAERESGTRFTLHFRRDTSERTTA